MISKTVIMLELMMMRTSVSHVVIMFLHLLRYNAMPIIKYFSNDAEACRLIIAAEWNSVLFCCVTIRVTVGVVGISTDAE